MPVMLTVASHTYTPPWEVRKRLKDSTMFDAVPTVDCVAMDVSSVLPGSLHVSVGVPWRYFSTVAVQVSMCCSPAVVTGLGETETSGGWRAVDNES